MKKFDDIGKDIDKNIPDLKLSISNQIDWNAVKQDNDKGKVKMRAAELATAGGTETISTKSRNNAIKITAAILMLAVFIITIIFTILPLGGGAVDTGFGITISITQKESKKAAVSTSTNNAPKESLRIGLYVDKNNMISEQKSLNESAAEVLIGVSYIGDEYKLATSSIIKLAESLGYIASNDIVNIYASNGKKNDDKKVSDLTNYLGEKIAGLTFGAMTEDEFDLIEDQLDDFDEEAFTEQTMIQLLAGVKAELATKTTKTEDIIKEIDFILSTNNTPLSNIKETRDGKKDNDEEDNNLIPPAELIALSNLFKQFDAAYGTEYYSEISDNEITYTELFQLKEDVDEELADLAQLKTEINEITDINELDGKYKDAIQDLLEIVKDDIFDRD